MRGQVEAEEKQHENGTHNDIRLVAVRLYIISVAFRDFYGAYNMLFPVLSNMRSTQCRSGRII